MTYIVQTWDKEQWVTINHNVPLTTKTLKITFNVYTPIKRLSLLLGKKHEHLKF
jgi:hypothetical protein